VFPEPSPEINDTLRRWRGLRFRKKTGSATRYGFAAGIRQRGCAGASVDTMKEIYNRLHGVSVTFETQIGGNDGLKKVLMAADWAHPRGA
jgi:hypothetical protein